MAVRNCSQRCSPPAQAPAPARRVRGAARARVARVSGARAGVPAAARAFARTVQYRGEASMPNGTKSRERRRSFSRYGTSTRSACTGTDRIYVASTSRQVEFTSHLQVLNVAFTPKIYVAHATRCELSSKVTVIYLILILILILIPGHRHYSTPSASVLIPTLPVLQRLRVHLHAHHGQRTTAHDTVCDGTGLIC